MQSHLRETKNKLFLNKLVKENWGYADKSYNLFKQRLFFERPIAKEYRKIIGDSPDLRKRILIDGNNEFSRFFEAEDKGFKYFREIFRRFIRQYDFSYNNFRDNKIIINKNEFKLFKAVRNFFFEKADCIYSKETKGFLVDDLHRNEAFFILNELVANVLYSLSLENDKYLKRVQSYITAQIGEEAPYINKFYSEANSKIESGVIRLQLFAPYDPGPSNSSPLKLKRDKYFNIETLDELKNFIDFLITVSSECIGKYKTPNNKKMEFVISLNPVDWVLCSTSENWSSCLSLESDYLFAYGLPGMVGDKNRALAYITDGKKKTFSFSSNNKIFTMEVDRFLSRSWLLLARSKKTKKTFLEVVKEYPNSLGIEKFVKKTFDIPILSEDSGNMKDFVSRYYIESIKFKDPLGNGDIFYGGYYDSCVVNVAKKNKTKYFLGDYLYYNFKSAGRVPSFMISEENKVIKNSVYISNYNFEEYYDNDFYENKLKFLIREKIKLNETLRYD